MSKENSSLPVLSSENAVLMLAKGLYDSGKITGALPERLREKGEWYIHRLAHGLRRMVQSLEESGKRVSLDAESMQFAIMKAVTSGVDPSGNFSSGWFIAYGNKVEFQLGFGGLRDVVLETGVVTAIDAELVYKEEPFSIHRQGMNQVVEHRILPAVRQSDQNIIGAYAVCLLTNGTELVEFAPRTEVDKAKQNTPAWRNWYGQQAKKFALKRLCNARIPFKGKDAARLQEVLDDEHRLDSGAINVEFRETVPEAEQPGVKGLKVRVAKPVAEAVPDAEPEPDPVADPADGAPPCSRCGGVVEGTHCDADGMPLCKACHSQYQADKAAARPLGGRKSKEDTSDE